MAKNRWRLCLPPLTLCLLDQALTLWNQPGEYWGGHYVSALEGNPLMRGLLSRHPLAYEAGVTAWMTLFLLLILFLPRRSALASSLAITFGHLWGVVSWVMYTAFRGFWICLALILAAALLTVLAWEKDASAGE